VNWRKVARWEFSKFVKSKQFLVMTFLLPLLMGGFGALPILIERFAGEGARAVAVVDDTGRVLGPLRERLADADWRLEAGRGAWEDVLARLEAGDYDGVLRVEAAQDGAVGRVRYYVSDAEAGGNLGPLRSALTDVVTRQRLSRAGYAPEEVTPLLAPVPVETVVTDAGQSIVGLVFAIGLAVLLMIGTMFSGGGVMYSVVKEKGNRVVELLLSSVSARELMGGKIIGIGATGLLQVTIWGGIAYGVASVYLDVPLINSLSLTQLVSYPLFFVLGYLVTASLYATLGAAMKDMQSGNQLSGFVVILPVVPLMLASLIIQDPTSVFVRVMSFIPFFTPGAMMLRLAATELPWWEVAAALAVLGAFVWALVRFAAKVFEVGMLMYGKQLNLREMWRWGVRRPA